MTAWRGKHPSEWNVSDVLDFIYSLKDVHLQTVYGERFRGLNGFQLCQLSQHEFRARDPEQGHLIYSNLRSLLDRRQSCKFNSRACFAVWYILRQNLQF